MAESLPVPVGAAARRPAHRGSARKTRTKERDPDYAVTVVGLFFYVVAVAGVLVLLDIE